MYCVSAIPPPHSSTLFPYTTLFRSKDDVVSDNGTNVRRVRTYAWSSSSSTPTLISTAETSVDGLKSWTTVWNNGTSLTRSEEHTSELQSLRHLVCRLLLEKKKKKKR